MRTFSALLLLCLLPSLCEAQLLRRLFGGRDRERYCPDGYCQPNSPSHPSIKPEPGVAPVVQPIDFAEIPVEFMVSNQGGNCVWCAVETAFSTAGYESVKGLKDRAVREGWGGAWITNVISALKDAGIPYKESQNGSMDIFNYAREQGVPVYVQVRVSRPEDHAIVVVGMDDTHVRVLDNNGPKKVQTWTMARFKSVWGGRACCPLFRKNRKPRDKDEPAKPIVAPAVCPCDQAALKALTDRLAALEKAPANNNVNTLTTNVTKLTELMGDQSKAVNSLIGAVNNLEGRVAKLEARGGETPPAKVLSRIEPVRNP